MTEYTCRTDLTALSARETALDLIDAQGFVDDRMPVEEEFPGEIILDQRHENTPL
jgi:hypothetical protein